MIVSQQNILIIAESINVEDSSGSKANVALILNLRDAGYKVIVYHYTRKEIELPGVKCSSIKERKFNKLFLLSRFQRKLQHGLKINLAKYLEPQFGFSFTFLNDSKSISRALKNINLNPDIVITLSKGASFRPHHALLSLPEFHKKWIAYIHDPYPFHYYPEPYKWSEPGYKKKIIFFNQVAVKCNWVAFPSLLLKEWMEIRFPSFKNKSLIIPHQLTEQDCKNIEIPDYFDPSMFNLLHAGNLMKQRPPFGLIQGFQEFLKRNPRAQEESRLLLIGDSSFYKKELGRLSKSIHQLFFSEGYVSYQTVLKLQKLASVNIILESKAEISPFLPGKFPHCVGAQKPILVLGPEKSEVRRLLGDSYPYWAEVDEINRISKVIEDLYLRWKREEDYIEIKQNTLQEYLSSIYLKEQIDGLSSPMRN